MNKLSIIVICQMFVACLACAQSSLDDIDRRAWHDAVSPLQMKAAGMYPFSVKKIKSCASDRVQSLSGIWTLSGADGINSDISVPCRVPGSIHTALKEAGIIPDPCVGRNDTAAERRSYQRWYVTRTFYYDGTMSSPLLSFKGVANKCRVFVNGVPVAEHEGMFGGPDIAVDKYLKRGENVIKVELLPIPKIYNGGWPATANEAWKHTVVSNCVYGWHYSKIPSMGIWNDVHLVDRPDLRIENPFFITRSVKGDMRMQLTLPKETTGEIRLLVRPYNFEGRPQAFVTTINKVKGNAAFDFNIKEPCLWWPNGTGSQNLYDAEVQLVADGKVQSVCARRFGVRTVEMKPLPEGEREDLYNWTFCINGRDMFVKGTGWCMMDALLDFSKERYDRFLSVARHQNIQLIRAWGGGMPETDIFYELCDEKGIMVMQEWPTAWNSHETQPFGMLEETVALNTVRLRNHPSLVMWGGGNESDKPYGKAIDMMGRLSVELDGSRPFHRAEAWGGSRHNYNCWWDEMHLNHNLNMTARFWGEFGVPSLPHAETVRKYLDGEKYVWQPDKESAFTHHTPIFGTNGEISRLGQYAGYFTSLETLEDAVLGSQMSQVVGVRHTLERARTMWPNTTGALYYKLNDNYPGLSWSSVDYYGAVKPLHYFARRAFEPATTVLLLDRTNMAGQEVKIPYYLLDDNNIVTGKTVKARLSVWNHKMQCVLDTAISVKPKGRVDKIADIVLTKEQTLSEMLYMKTDLIKDDGTLVARNWYFCNYDTRRGVMLESRAADVRTEQDGKNITITNISAFPAVGVTVDVPGQSSQLLLSDNYLWLDPGETVTVGSNISCPAVVSWWNSKNK